MSDVYHAPVVLRQPSRRPFAHLSLQRYDDVHPMQTTDLATVRRALGTSDPLPRNPLSPDRAAVAGIFHHTRGAGTLEILLIRRAERKGDPWSGHMAFPGGRWTPGDGDLLATARRETWEEVGIALEQAELLGHVADVRAHLVGTVVRPFFFAVPELPSLNLNHEVAETIWTPLDELRAGARDVRMPYPPHAPNVRLPAYDVEGHFVWGLTYKMLQALFAALDSVED